MSPLDFETLCHLARIKRHSTVKHAAADVLLHGHTQVTAAAAHGVTQSAVSKTIRRIRLAHAAAIKASRIDPA